MSVLAEFLDPKFNFQVGSPKPTRTRGESRKAEASPIGPDRAGRLVGAAGLYVVFVTGMLWSAPAWVVVIAPFVQMGVGRLMLWSLWK